MRYYSRRFCLEKFCLKKPLRLLIDRLDGVVFAATPFEPIGSPLGSTATTLRSQRLLVLQGERATRLHLLQQGDDDADGGEQRAQGQVGRGVCSPLV